MENGYKLWTFSGIPLSDHPTEKFKQLHWRPRPPTLLSKDEQRTVRRNLREYSKEFEEIDREMEEGAAKEVVEMRRRLLMEFYSWVAEEKEMVQAERDEVGRPDPEEERLELMKTRSGADGGAEGEKTVEVVEDEVIEETEEIIA